ncbi:14780_t:CDS:1, partial [Funneliformis mosseae]
ISQDNTRDRCIPSGFTDWILEPEPYESFESHYAIISQTTPEADVSPRDLQAIETPGFMKK